LGVILAVVEGISATSNVFAGGFAGAALGFCSWAGFCAPVLSALAAAEITGAAACPVTPGLGFAGSGFGWTADFAAADGPAWAAGGVTDGCDGFTGAGAVLVRVSPGWAGLPAFWPDDAAAVAPGAGEGGAGLAAAAG